MFDPETQEPPPNPLPTPLPTPTSTEPAAETSCEQLVLLMVPFTNHIIYALS